MMKISNPELIARINALDLDEPVILPPFPTIGLELARKADKLAELLELEAGNSYHAALETLGRVPEFLGAKSYLREHRHSRYRDEMAITAAKQAVGGFRAHLLDSLHGLSKEI